MSQRPLVFIISISRGLSRGGRPPLCTLSLRGAKRRGNPFPARHCRADGTAYPKGICSAALHGRTPFPTFVIRQARLPLRRGRCPHRPAVGNRIPAAGHAGPALQGVCVRADRVVRRDGISTGTRAVEHQGTHRGSGQRRATAHRGKLWRHNPLNREKPGNRLRVGQVSAKSQPTRVRKS